MLLGLPFCCLVLLGALVLAASAADPASNCREEQDCSSSLCPCPSSGLTFKLYDNAALAGTPSKSGITSSAHISLAKHHDATSTSSSSSDKEDNYKASCYLSGELSGSLNVAAANKGGGIYQFDCQFFTTSTGFVWIDGHLVCQDGNTYRPTHARATLGIVDNPLTVVRTLPFRARISSNDTSCVTIGSLQVDWKKLSSRTDSSFASLSETRETQPFETQLDGKTTTNTTKYSAGGLSLSPHLPPAEERRDHFQRNLGNGWGAWLRHNMLSLVKLPEGIIVTPILCQKSSNTCLDQAIPDSREIRVGLHAYDRSYVTYHMAYQTANVTIEFSVQNDKQLYFVLTTNEFPNNDPEDYEIRITGRYGWFRPGNVSATQNSLGTPQLTFVTPGLGLTNVTLTTNTQHVVLASTKRRRGDDALLHGSNTNAQRQLAFTHAQDGIDDSVATKPYLCVPINQPNERIGFGANIPSLSTEAIHDKILALKVAEEDRIRKKFGAAKYAVAEAIQSTVMWTLIYNPVENDGLFMPVSRTESWSFRDDSGASTFDWTYVIFDWDNFFASLLAGLDNKDIAYSNIFQVVKSKTAAGFVPNVASGGSKTQDRTEPAVGAKAMLELFRKYNDTWAVEVVFDDLLDWNNWFLSKRILQPAGLIALGSHTEVLGPRKRQLSSLSNRRWDDMQLSRFESGMDNSPMYDGDLYDNRTHLMQLYDVGMSSLFVQEAYSLAELAIAIGRDSNLVEMLRARGDAMRDKISAELWDPQQQAFVNRFPNGTFVRHVSPTSFYPIFAGAATKEQGELMVMTWLMNASRFCISPNGDFAGNDPDGCYWGLPSISADDPAFMAPGEFHYWRGLVWGPLAQLTWWSLQENEQSSSGKLRSSSFSSPLFSQARKALCKQMEALMMSQWNAHRHTCENYHPSKNEGGDCTGTPFYHWGALHGLIGMMEDGHWY